jgi:hypothetical protein
MKPAILLCALLLFSGAVFAGDHGENSGALANTVILIIRHAEKPESGSGLSPAGQERAQAYVNYFKNLTLDNQPLKIDSIFAAADSKESRRPRLTIEPTAKALHLPIDSRFKDKDFQALADEIHSKFHGRVVLIAWHHGQIPSLIHALGGDAEQAAPDGKWPEDVFGWLIELRYDAQGQLVETRRINENLMPDDTNKHSEKPGNQ